MHPPDKHNKQWCWNNYLSQRALQSAENVRQQLERIMSRHNVKINTTKDERMLSDNVRKALVCGFFMQVARKGEHGGYETIKDNQAVALDPSCGLNPEFAEYVLFNEFVLTMRPYIRNVSEVKLPWSVVFFPVW